MYFGDRVAGRWIEGARLCIASPPRGRPRGGGVGAVVLGESLITAALFSSLGGGLGEMPDRGAIQQLGLPVADERCVHGAPPLLLGGGPITEVGAGESTGSSATKTPRNKPFILSEGLPTVPYKLTAGDPESFFHYSPNCYEVTTSLHKQFT